MHSVKIDRELSDEFIGNVMVTMVESGYDSLFYWGHPTTIERDEASVPVLIALREDEAIIEAQEAYASDGHEAEVVVHVVKPDMVVQAIQAIIDRKLVGSHYMQYLTRAVLEGDAGDIDATIADCILQVACFNEVRYG